MFVLEYNNLNLFEVYKSILYKEKPHILQGENLTLYKNQKVFL